MAKEKLQKGDKIPYTQIANAVLNDPFLSFKAKGLYAYLYSKDDKYDFAAKRISKDGSDGIDSVLAGLRELETSGYLSRKRLKTGRVVYTISIAKLAKPQKGKKPKRENPNQGNSQLGKIPAITNLDGETNLDKKQTFYSEEKELKSSLLKKYEDRWDTYGGDRAALLESLRFKVVRGDEELTRVPALISDFISFQEECGRETYEWTRKEDFMATMRNLTNRIFKAGIHKISGDSWNRALERTSLMDMATINTVINAV